MLRPRRQRPCCSRAAERNQECPSSDVACHVTLRLGVIPRFSEMGRTMLLHCDSLEPPMSPLGQTQTFHVGSMSALSPISSHRSARQEGPLSAKTGREQMQQHAVRGREGRVIPAAGTSDYCGSLCSGRRLLRRPYGFIPFYLLFERVVFARPVSTFAGDTS